MRAPRYATPGDAPHRDAPRRSFIRKVYGVLSVQLAITFSITLLFVLNSSVKAWVQSHPAAFYSAIAISFVFICALSCFRAATRTVPLNYFML